MTDVGKELEIFWPTFKSSSTAELAQGWPEWSWVLARVPSSSSCLENAVCSLAGSSAPWNMSLCHNKIFWAGWVAAAVSSLIPRALLSAKGFLPAGKTNATFWWNHTRYLWELWSCKLDSFFICVSGGSMSWYKDHRRVKESWTVFLCYCHSKPAADLKQECAVWSSTSGWNSCQNLGLDLYSVLEQILVQLKVILYTVGFQFLLWRWCIRWSAMTIKSIFQSYIF